MPRAPEPPEPPEPAEPDEPAVQVAVDPALTATSLGEYLRGVWVRLRGGETGALPVVAGLILISALFQYLNSNFLTAGNMVNLLVQGSVFMLLAMGEVFVLLLGEIDLSLGYVGGLGGVIMAELISNKHNWPWWAGVLAGLAVCCCDRGLPGHDHHPDRAAVVRGDSGRPAGLAGRDAADPRQRWRGPGQ